MQRSNKDRSFYHNTMKHLFSLILLLYVGCSMSDARNLSIESFHYDSMNTTTDTVIHHTYIDREVSEGLLLVEFEPKYSEVWIDGEKKGTTPYDYFKIPIGIHKVEIKRDGYVSKTKEISIIKGETIWLKGNLDSIPSHPSKTFFYVEANFQAGMLMGVGASVGAYIHNFNIEWTFLLGLAESEEIAWKQTSQSGNLGYSYTYKPMFFGLKLGYRIPSELKFRITPQLGIGVSSISGSQVRKGSGTDPDATSCYAVPASVGARFEYYFTKNFGLSASPEFGFAVMKSDTYTKLSDISSKVKGFGSGFNARVGVFVSF